MMKKLEIFGVIFLLIIGLIWGGFEIWIRKYADGKELLQKGDNHWYKKKKKEAKFFYKLAAYKNEPQAYEALIPIYKNEKNFAEVAENYQKILKGKPDDYFLLDKLAITYQILGENKKAEETFKRAYKDCLQAAYNNIGDIYVEIKDWPKAIENYKIALKMGHCSAADSLYKIYELQNKFGEIEKLTAQCIAENNLNSLSFLGDYYSKRNPQFAIKCLQKLEKSSPLNSLDIAKIYLRQKNFYKANEYCQKALKADPNYCGNYPVLADYYSQIGNQEKAYKYVLKILKNSPVKFVKFAVKTNHEQQAVAELEKLYKKAATIYKKLELTFCLYYLYETLKQPEQMQKTIARHITENDQFMLNETIASNYSQLGEYDKALQWYLKDKTSPPRVQREIAKTYKKQQKYELALKNFFEYLGKLEKYDYEYGFICDEIAEIFYLQEEYIKALKFAKLAQESYSHNANLFRKIYFKLAQEKKDK